MELDWCRRRTILGLCVEAVEAGEIQFCGRFKAFNHGVAHIIGLLDMCIAGYLNCNAVIPLDASHAAGVRRLHVVRKT